MSASWKEIEKIEIVHKKISRYPDKDYFYFFCKRIKRKERCYVEVRKDTIKILKDLNKFDLLPQFEWSKMRDKKMQDALVIELQSDKKLLFQNNWLRQGASIEAPCFNTEK